MTDLLDPPVALPVAPPPMVRIDSSDDGFYDCRGEWRGWEDDD